MKDEHDQTSLEFAAALGVATDVAQRTRETPIPAGPLGTGLGAGGVSAISPIAGLDARPSVEEAGGDNAGEAGKPIEQAESIGELARHIRAVFERNATHRRMSGVDDMLLRMQRLASREYSEHEKALIAKTRTPAIFVGELDKKRIALSAMISEIFANAADPPWSLEPTPEPEVPDSVTARAVKAVMEPITQINEAALMLHLAKVKAGQAQEDEPPAGLIGPQEVEAAMSVKMDQVRQLQLEEARRAAEAMARKVNDQMTEGGFYDAFREAVDFLTTYGTVVMYGPLPRMRRKTVYTTTRAAAPTAANGVAGGAAGIASGMRQTLTTKVVPVLEYGVFSPWDCYPAPGAKDVDDGEFIVRRRFNPSELAQWARAKRGDKLYGGWNAGAVNGILARWPQGGLRETLQEDALREQLQNESGETRTEPGYIEGLEMFGTVRGSELLGIGIRKATGGGKIDESEYYDVDAITIHDTVVCCRIDEPGIGRPLAKAVVFPKSESWWGEGPMHKAEAAQRVMNSCARWMCANMGQSAAPQLIVTDRTRLQADETLEMYPGKVWLCDAPGFGSPSQGAPIQLLQPSSNLSELLGVYKHFKQVVDDLSGVPDYSYGGTSGAAVRSSSALAMLTEGSTRIVKYCIGFVDRMVRELVMKTYAWNMLHGDDESVKGDVSCNPSGVMGLLLVEQNYNRLMQFLQLTNNAQDAQIVSTLGRATILREIAKMLRLNPDKLVGDEQTLQERQRLAELKQELEVMQQQANVEATEQGMENQAQMMEERGESGNPPINAERAAAAQTRRNIEQLQKEERDRASPMTPQGRGALRSVLSNPQGRAMAASRAAATRAARRGAMEG